MWLYWCLLSTVISGFTSIGFVVFNGISNFINKIYVAKYQSPLYVVFNYAIIISIGIFAYCLITKQWNYIDIRKIKSHSFLNGFC